MVLIVGDFNLMSGGGGLCGEVIIDGIEYLLQVWIILLVGSQLDVSCSQVLAVLDDESCNRGFVFWFFIMSI